MKPAQALRPVSWTMELLVVCLVMGAGFVSIPLSLGEIGLSWDGLNHHFYLGWTAQRSRFELDYLAASFQSYQSPYLYWPAYKLAESGFSGAAAGTVLALLQGISVPAVWLIARSCIPERTWFGVAMRMAAVALGYLSIVVLSMFDTTANDLLAAAPMMWAMAFAIAPLDPNTPRWLTLHRAVAVSGFMAGLAVAVKLSNGPLAILMPIPWMFLTTGWRGRGCLMLIGCAWVLVGFLLAYGGWGWQLWENFGNPFYPFMEGWFEPIRRATGWQK